MAGEQSSNEGRSSSFVNGARAQSPEAKFRSLQQGAGKQGYRPRSTLTQNQIMASANGMSQADRARAPFGGPLSAPSVNGQSDNTFESRLWLDSAARRNGG